MLSYQDFKKEIEMGTALSFRYDQNFYAISSNSNGFYLYPYLAENLYKSAEEYDDSNDQEFSSAEDLFENARIDGKRIEQIWSQIDKISIC